MDVERGEEEANGIPRAEDALDLEEGELREDSPSSTPQSKDAVEMEVEGEPLLDKGAATAEEDGKKVRAKRRSDNGEHEHTKKRSKDKKAKEDNGGRHKRHRSGGEEGGGRDEEGTTSYKQHGDGAADGEGDRRKKRKEERSSANHHHDHRDDHHSRHHREHHKDRSGSGSDKRERSSSSSRDKRASEERHSGGRSERERSRHSSRERERERDGRVRDGGEHRADRGRSSSRENRSRDGSSGGNQKRRLDEPHGERYDRDDQGRDRRGYDRPDERDHRGTGDRRHERDYERGRERYRDEYRGRDDERHGHERSGGDGRRRRDDDLTNDARLQEQEKKTKQTDDADYAKMVEEELRRKETEQTEEEKAQKLIEERRKRRQAILDKYKQDKTATAPVTTTTTVDETPAAAAPAAPSAVVAEASAAATVEVRTEKNDEEEKAKEMGADLQPQPEEPKKVTHFDMFNELPAALIPSDQASRRPLGAAAATGEDELNLADNWDDEEGYYAFRIGEIINKRYTVHASHGKGVFSTVLIAKDAQNENIDVAIKVIRNNDTMFRAGLKEKELLEKITAADPKDKRHCIRIFDSFQYRNHLCLVLEPMSMNLREAVKKFGRDVGITMRAVRTYARQLFLSLKHLKSLNMLHADLKPDNIVLNAKLNVLKLCDFGSASLMEEENAITPYLVSRFYRAPEIMLGLPYDFGIDMWAAGCCLYEMYTGKILYPGKSNNEMLRMQMESMGPFPRKMLRKSKFWQRHFNVQNFHFLQICIDEVSQQEYVKEVNVLKPVRDLKAELQKAAGVEDEAMGDAAQLADLMLKCLVLDPAKRLSAEQALAHPFLKA